jgi:hypothetical protein
LKSLLNTLGVFFNQPVLLTEAPMRPHCGARCFLRLANLDNGAFERLSRYEATLWRQVGQILFTLDALRPGGPGNRYHRARYMNLKSFRLSNDSVASPRLRPG